MNGNVFQSPILNTQTQQPQLWISYAWYHIFHQFIISFGFEVNTVDDFVYHRLSESKFVFLVLGKYLRNPSLDHKKATKWILRYLYITKGYMLNYRKSDVLEIIFIKNLILLDAKMVTDPYRDTFTF